MRKALVGAGLVAMAAFTLGACGGDDDAGNELAEQLAEGATGGDIEIDEDSGEVSFEGEDGSGSFNVGGGEMPDDLADFPIPDDSEILSSYSGSSDESSGSVVSLAANGDYEEVSADMQSELEGAGFEISGTYTAEANGVGSSTFTAEGDGMSISVAVTEDTTSSEGFDLLISIVTTQDMSTESTG